MARRLRGFTRAFAVLSCRPFRLYWLGQSFSTVGSAFSALALVFAVLDRTHSAADLGLVLLSSRLPAIAFALVGGVLGDRFSRRTVLLVADTARTLIQAATAALILLGADRLFALALLQSASGVAGALFSPSAGGLVAELAPEGQLRQANSLLAMSRSVGGILAVGAAGAVVALAGAGPAFAVDSASFAVSTVSLALLCSAALDCPPARAAGVLDQLAEGWRAVREQRWLWSYIGHVALLNALGVSPLFVLGPLVAARSLGGATGWAAIAMGYGLGAFAASLCALRFQPRRPMRAIYLASLALAPLLALVALRAPLWAITAVAVAAGAQSTAYNVWATATVQAEVPRHLLSRVSSVVTLGGLAAVPAGMSLSGLGADAIGAPAVLGFAAAAVVVLTAGALVLGSGGPAARDAAVATPPTASSAP